MQKRKNTKLLSYLLCMALMVAIALFTGGCGDKTESAAQDVGTQADVTVQQLGEGETQFLFTVVDKDGNETQFEIHTDKEIVGEALEELSLIAGEESEYGLYVKEVNGITADYDTDGVYWAFYINDEYASTGVDATTITAGGTYSFKME